MNRIDDILDSLKGQQPMIDDPEALTDRIMDSLPDLEPNQQEDEGKARIVSFNWRWMAAAASILLIIGIGSTLWLKEAPQPSILADANIVEPNPHDLRLTDLDTLEPQTSTPPTHVARKDRPSSEPSANKAPAFSTSPANSEYVGSELPVRRVRTQSSPDALPLHYASIQTTVDTTYQDPARMDEFIAKMADFNEVEGISLDCTGGAPDSTVISKAYVFDDTQELDVFGRLLQVACWYDSKTPGYLLNFSHQQLFFTLKDMHKNQKYLWIAERIMGDRILLYCTHSPIETNVSSTCYQKYREQLTHSNLRSLPF